MKQQELPLPAESEAARPPAPRARTPGGYLFLFCACAGMFVLGVLVGRGTAPVRFDIDRLQEELTQLRGALAERVRQPARPAPAPRHDKPLEPTDLEFYEDLKDPKEAARIYRDLARVDVPPGGIGAAPTPAAKSAPPAPAPAPALPAESAARKPAPLAAEPPPAPRLAMPETAPKGEPGTVNLQVASLVSISEADALVAKLRGRGFAAYRTTYVIPGQGVRYRVRIGGYRSRGEAETDAARLKNDKYQAIVVPNGA